jgi:hypothetical protein
VRGVIAILAFVLAACATDAPRNQWTKPGSSSGDLAVDLYVCSQWSKSPDDPDRIHEPYLRDCMTGHGWKDVASEP